MKIGLVGCGNISDIYLANLSSVFTNASFYACSDLDAEKVQKAAQKYNIPHIMTFEEMLECDEIDVILNLTTPKSHYALSYTLSLSSWSLLSRKPQQMLKTWLGGRSSAGTTLRPESTGLAPAGVYPVIL